MKNKNDIFDLVDEIIERKTKEEVMRRIDEMYNDRHFIYSPIFSPVHKKKKSSVPYVTTLILIFLWFCFICVLCK